MSEQQHQSDPTVLDRRTLWRDHRRLVELLVPGMSVLDVGCGTGAITRGIAEAVGPGGLVVGVDRDRAMLERAGAQGATFPNLRFEEGDATRLGYEACFDIVTAARTLQWVADLRTAVERMARAAKPGGLLVVLDYNHARNRWDPSPPQEFAEFYGCFLAWREANGWDNEVADHCPALLDGLGLQVVRSDDQTETTTRGAGDFDERSALWTEVIDRIGPVLAQAQVCRASLVEAARRSYETWRTTELVTVTLSMRTTVARVR